jgi:hypothetical protein
LNDATNRQCADLRECEPPEICRFKNI